MEKNEPEQRPEQSGANNSVNNYGTVYGTFAGTVNFNGPIDPKKGNLPRTPVETAVWKGTVVKLVGEGLIDQALAEIVKANPPEEIKRQAILIAGRSSHIKIESMAGTIDKEMELKELSKIRQSIMTLISGI